MVKVTVEIPKVIYDMMKILKKENYGTISDFMRDGLVGRIDSMYASHLKTIEYSKNGGVKK